MATGEDLERAAMALEGTTSAPHFDRTAFKVKRTFVTLAADRKTANFKFTPDEQALKCAVAPDAFFAIANGWGRQGWTTADLSALTLPELEDAVTIAWRHAVGPPPRRR